MRDGYTEVQTPDGRTLEVLTGGGPYDGEGLDWQAGMAEENVVEYTTAANGRDAYAAWCEEEFMPTVLADADDLAEAMGGLLPPADKAAMDRGFTEWLAASFHHAGAQRAAGVVDDGRAAVLPWGFDVASIRVPTQRPPADPGRPQAGRGSVTSPGRTSPVS